MSNSCMYIYVHTLSSHKKVLGNGTDVGLGPRILLDIERLSNAVIMSSLLDEISVGLTSPIKIYTLQFRIIVHARLFFLQKKIALHALIRVLHD